MPRSKPNPLLHEATTKLYLADSDQITAVAQNIGITRSQFIRSAILERLQTSDDLQQTKAAS